MLKVRQVSSNSPETGDFMHKRSLVLLSAFLLALCVPPLHAGTASGKKTVQKKTVQKKRTVSKSKKSASAMNTPDQTTITPGGSLNSGNQTSYDPKKGPRRPAPPKKKKP
jgi:hypothetical protein